MRRRYSTDFEDYLEVFKNEDYKQVPKPANPGSLAG
jgi:hypothetical protein